MLNLVANGPSGYNLTNSLRFRSSASAYLNRTPGSASNQQTWTLSFWVKRGGLSSFTGTYQDILCISTGTTDATNFQLSFQTNDTLQLDFYTYTPFVTTQVFRDPSAWYHIVLAFDTTQATAANRMKLYVNGSQVTAGTFTYPSQNANTAINSTNAHNFFRNPSVASKFFDGYVSEINLVDGQQLTPSSFGSTNATTGVWQPAKYTGTYGTNGFYLNFSSIALTSGSNTGLGKDYSGNGNYWNTNNISVTAGTTYDAMTDVPTLTSATVANYAVMNPLNKYVGGNLTLSNGNLTITKTSQSSDESCQATIGTNTGKYYWEVTLGSLTNLNLGLAAVQFLSTDPPLNWVRYLANGGIYNNSTTLLATAASWTSGDVIGFALDNDGDTLALYKNNSLQYTITSLRSNLGGISTSTLVSPVMYTGGTSNNSISNWNFGQQPFSYTPPTGFVALNTYNLPTPTILQGNKYMDATTYTGNGSTQSITNTAGFKPDLVWVKSRSAATDHKLTDSVRGVTKALISDTTGAETTDTNGLTAFNSNGWSLGTDTNYNNNTATYVGWQWQAGQGSTSSNTSGSITSTVSVNASAGFSVVTYTGTGSAATVGHGLGVAPSMIITKKRSSTSDWGVYHISTGNTNYLLLDSTAASASSSTYWNNTSPTSSVFSIGTADPVNISTATYVAYCWAAIPGFSAFGSYVGNGSSDGPFIYLGFRPKYVIIKNTSLISHWTIEDTSTNPYNVAINSLYSDTSAATNTTVMSLDFLSNGFKCRNVLANESNVSGSTYIYMAFAENPFRNSLAR